ncbi:MAG TPA: DUF4835 family protein [Chitinophagaceae bacterium]|nr:DUF4835 family protein [Chitinophagaceae bacterium]HMU59541.1 DUF4835 family protein [Chitinophagaceae bacterium]
MLKKFLLFILLAGVAMQSGSQELQARISVLTSKVSTQVDKKIFQTLQTQLTNFMNTRKWTNDGFQQNEKIQCSFLITIEEDMGGNVFKGKLTVQAARPVYNTDYQSPIINFLDDNLVFKYQEFQPIEFNENRVQGNDPLTANITAVLAYYANLILGFDYNSFSQRGGDVYFQKAWNIVNNAPENSSISGWKSFESQRNRYWLAENLNNNRFALIHDAVYAYYRSGMDVFYENEEAGRTGILNCLNYLNVLNTENPNSMILQFFMQGKSNELVKVFSKATAEQKSRAKEMLSKIDITNANAYKELK